MSRVYRHSPPSTIRRPSLTRSTQPRLAHPPAVTPVRPVATRGARTSLRGRTMHAERPNLQRNDNTASNENNDLEQRTVHVGDGFHMFTPSTTKREQIRRQAENEQRQYEAHVERTRLHGIHEVHRLGGDGLSEEEVRRRQAEKFQREKIQRLEKMHQDQLQRKQQEEKDIETRKQAARQQATQNEKQNRNTQVTSILNENNEGATGWTDTDREADRKETMDRFLNRLTHQYDDMNISSDNNQTTTHNDKSKSEKLSILRDMLPHIDDQTLEYHLEVYNGNIDAIISELAN